MQLIYSEGRFPNWTCLKSSLGGQEVIPEGYPIRLGTMHSRVITQDDELFLAVECKSLMNAIGKRRSF
jgi:hypothetical protein